MTYPTATDLCAMGITLIPDVWWNDRLEREYRSRVYADQNLPFDLPRKAFTSQYVGVRRRYSGWVGGWMVKGKYVTGLVRATESEAAEDRARALGRQYVEWRE